MCACVSHTCIHVDAFVDGALDAMPICVIHACMHVDAGADVVPPIRILCSACMHGTFVHVCTTVRRGGGILGKKGRLEGH